MWFCKRKQPVINFIPLVDGSLTENMPVVPAKDILPKWWEAIKVNKRVSIFDHKPASTGTARRCPGIIDILKHGWVIPLWCDIAIQMKGTDKIQWKPSDPKYFATTHSHDQLLDFVPEHIKSKYLWVLKLKSPWAIVTSPGYSIMQLDPFYHFNEYFDAAWGIQDTDFYHDANNFLFLKKDGDYVIERGTPLCVIYPFKREKITGIVEAYDEKRAKKMEADIQYFGRSKFSSLLSYKKEQHKRKKCPFH